MPKLILLGIDCGGTHTDAALLAIDEKQQAKLLASAKTTTIHEDIPKSICNVINLLKNPEGKLPALPERITLGTTLEINSLIQNLADPVGLALSAGPGLDPIHFGLGEHVCIVPGGLDHRGQEVKTLYLDVLKIEAEKWAAQGIKTIACVGKFSPRNPAHEAQMAEVAQKASGLPIVMGHNISGSLNFPRRIATAYYSAAVSRLHAEFLDSVETALAKEGINGQLRLLKADGGAIPFKVSRHEPAQSILSGPAASVMGILALWREAQTGCSLLLDIGGTTTDLAMFLDGSPVVDRRGMNILGRRTLVRSLASISIGIGGDSAIAIETSATNNSYPQIKVGPMRFGPAMAFGGAQPTLLDALNVLDKSLQPANRGDLKASMEGMAQLAARHSLNVDELAAQVVKTAIAKIAKAIYDLVEGINSRPIYTLAALKAAKEARPQKACLIGGPAQAIQPYLQQALQMPVAVSPCAQVANAIGAALTLPTASLEMYADTGKKQLSVPAYNFQESIPSFFTLEQAEKRGCELLEQKLKQDGLENTHVEITEADLFATLDDHGRSAKDIRVICQARPGIAANFQEAPGE